MTRIDTRTKSTAQWLRRIPAEARWQTLQSQLSQHAGTASSGWTRRSAVLCKWRALPAGVSARTPAGRS